MEVKIEKVIRQEVKKEFKKELNLNTSLNEWKKWSKLSWSDHIRKRLSEDYAIYFDKTDPQEKALIREISQRAFDIWETAVKSYQSQLKELQKSIINSI